MSRGPTRSPLSLVLRRRPRLIALGVAVLVAALVGGVVQSGLLGGGSAAAAFGPPGFLDETASSGISDLYDGGFDYAAGGGVAVFDCNGDGKPDLYIAGGRYAAALYRNESPVGGALRFTRVTDPATDLVGVTGAYPIDIDGDGIVDLVVLRAGADDVLLRGLGGCRFERANERWGFTATPSITMAFSATWEAGAKLPTLAFGRYVDPASNDPHHLCFDNALLRPAGTGTTYATPIPLTPSWCALSMLFSDWSRSGRMDLRVSNDRHYYLPTEGQEQLWRVVPNAPPTLYTADDGWVAVQIEGMGIASYDLTGDGYPSVYLTSQADNRLQTLAAGPSRPTYRDIGLRRGVNSARPFTGGDLRPSTAWHAEFADVNNDGFVDLFVGCASGEISGLVRQPGLGRWATGSGCASSSPRRTPTRSARGSRCARAIASSAASSPSVAVMPAASWGGRTSASATRAARTSARSGRAARPGRGSMSLQMGSRPCGAATRSRIRGRRVAETECRLPCGSLAHR